PPDPLPLLARRPPTRARPGSVAGPVQLPPRGEAAAELPRLALRDPLLAARRGIRPRRWVERPAAPLLRAGRPRGMRVAARARLAPGPGTRRRARICDRALPRRAKRRPSARTDLDPPSPFVVGLRAGAARNALVARARRRGAGIDSALGPGASRARSNPVFPRL